MKRFLTALTAAVLATAAPAFADTSSSTPILQLMDRPTQTQSTYTVAPNQILLEAGYANGSNSSGHLASFPNAKVRIGTTLKGLEVYANAPSIARDGSSTIVTDIGAGVKYLIKNSKNYAVSAQLGVQLPTGYVSNTNATISTGTQTAFAVNGTYKINDMFSLKTTQGFVANNAGGVRYGSYAPSYALLAMLPASTSVFVEYSALTKSAGPGTSGSHTYLIGAAHAINERLAIDVEGTRTPSNNGFPKANGIGAGAAYSF